MGAAVFALPSGGRAATAGPRRMASRLPEAWFDPPREFSQAPFWFWNDDLSEAEIVRQLEDFQGHGVYAFVIHARAGLPRSIGWLGYDFTEHLPSLWHADEPDAVLHRRNYHRALQKRLEQTFYRQISAWCDSHGIALTGHPMGPGDIGHLRHFHIPGQDIVWRYIEPGKASARRMSAPTTSGGRSTSPLHRRRRASAG